VAIPKGSCSLLKLRSTSTSPSQGCLIGQRPIGQPCLCYWRVSNGNTQWAFPAHGFSAALKSGYEQHILCCVDRANPSSPATKTDSPFGGSFFVIEVRVLSRRVCIRGENSQWLFARQSSEASCACRREVASLLKAGRIPHPQPKC